MKRKLLFVAGISLAALLVYGALVAVVLAADPTPTPGPNGKGSIQQTFISKLAQALGIQEQQLTDAIKKAQNGMVDDAVQAGKLTPDQASKLKDRIDKGQTWGAPRLNAPRGRFNGRGFGAFEPMLKTGTADLANFLGMNPADLTAELRQGKTLAQVGEEHGKTRDQLKEAILSGIQKRLDQAVTNGKLTKDKEDQMLKTAGDQVDKLLDRSFKAPNGTPKGNPQKQGTPAPNNTSL